MRGPKDSKSSTCTESAEVDAAGISVKVGALTRGGLTVCRRGGDTEHREVRPSRQKSAEGIVGRLDAAEGPNTERRVGARTSMTKQTLDSMAEMPESAAGGSRRNRRGSASGASNVTAGRGNGDPSEQRWTGEPSLTPSTLADGFVNRRIRNRTYGGVGGRRGVTPPPTRSRSEVVRHRWQRKDVAFILNCDPSVRHLERRGGRVRPPNSHFGQVERLPSERSPVVTVPLRSGRRPAPPASPW